MGLLGSALFASWREGAAGDLGSTLDQDLGSILYSTSVIVMHFLLTEATLRYMSHEYRGSLVDDLRRSGADFESWH